MKRLFSILLSLALCMIAAGCSNTGGQTSPQPANSSLESSGAVQTPPSSQTEPSGSQSESSQPEEPASSSQPETPSSSAGSELPEESSSAVSEPVSSQPPDGSAFDLENGTVPLNNGETMPVLGIGTFRLSQEQAAAKLQLQGLPVSREILSQMERGLYSIRISVFLALKELYGAEFSEFFENL